MADMVEIKQEENMLKKVLNFSILLIILALAVPAIAQEANIDESVLLRWKVPYGKVIAFKTSMDPVDPQKENILEFNFEQLVESKELPPGIRDKLIIKMPKEYSMTSILKPLPNGNISAKIIMGKASMPEASDSEMEKAMIEMIKKMEGTVQLRGEITDSGKISSFYLEPKQKNLLALFFELPQTPVKVGDIWSLDVNLLSMGAGFICKKANRVNHVRLVSLSDAKDGDIIASMDYVIAESVKGKFMVPFSDQAEPTSLSMTFVGRGDFLVKKGVWKKFTGRMQIEQTGMMSSDVQQHFAMELMDKVPGKFLKLE
jgi:hypothetical protein